MKVRWRQYELIFAIAIFLFIGCDALWLSYNFQTTPGMTALRHFMTVAFLPFLFTYGVALALLLAINLWLLPRYLYRNNQFVALPIGALCCFAILAIAHCLAISLRLQPAYRGASLDSTRQILYNQAIALSGVLTIAYILYGCLREPLIKWLETHHTEKPLRILIINRIMATAFFYIGLMVFMIVFDLMRSDGAAIMYLFVLLPVIIIVFITLYSLLPAIYALRKGFWISVRNLSIAPLALAIISWLIFVPMKGMEFFWIIPLHALLLAAIALPIAWLLFIQQKDKLMTILQLEKNLGKTTADLAFLRSQINPHFLFNTLNTLYGTALQENATRTATGIQRLGDMMRFLLHDNNRDTIPLSRELEYLENFMALQNLRIAQSQGIRIETSIHPCTRDRLIAPMLLIPFAENAYKHGIRLTSSSYIRIHFHCDSKGIYLDVVNSLHTQKNTEGLPGESGVGLKNVQQRLEHLYPGKYSLQINEDDTSFSAHLFIALTETE